MKYIIDTDIGDDIDDAFALDLMLRLKFDIIGITTVFRNTEQRAKIAKKMLALYGRDIPVYAGYGETLNGNMTTNETLCQYTSDLENPKFLPDGKTKEDAIDFIIESAEKWGDELSILSIGPLTNLAYAVQKNSSAMSKVNQICLMGGDYKNQYSEWNILCDIEAAKIVFEADLPLICFGHELTSKTRVSKSQQLELFNLCGSEYKKYLAQLTNLWYKSKPEGYLVILHDVLTAYYFYDNNFFNTVEILVKIEDKGEVTKGMTVNLSIMDHYDLSKAHKIKYAECKDVDQFAGKYMDIIKGDEE